MNDTSFKLFLFTYMVGVRRSLLKGEVAAIEKVGQDGDHKGMPDSHANLVLDLIENQQKILGYYKDTAYNYDGS